MPGKAGRSSSCLVWSVIGLGLVVLGCALLIGLADDLVAAPGSTVPMEVEYAAPDLRLTDMAQRPVALSDYRGQVVLVNLWATWCPPCRAEMPVLQEYYLNHRESGFVIVAINDGDPLDQVATFVAEYGLTFPVWPDPHYSGTKAFRTNNLPSSYVIDRQGIVRLAWIGEIDRATLECYVTPLIEEQ